MTEERICNLEELKKCGVFSLKQVQTMMISKVPWRKPPIPKQVAVICTRLILPAVFPAVKEYGFQRGSERTICSCKCPSRTVKGGARPVLLPVPIHAPPVQADNLVCLPKSMVVAVPTHPPAVTKPNTQFQQKEDAAKKGCILLSIIWTYICPFPAGS